jgi:hypothetical protein
MPKSPTLDAPEDEADLPSLIVATNRTPTIDPTNPEDCPDRPDGEWSKGHLLRFLARQPKDMVLIPKEAWEPKGEDTYQTVGYLGHWFRILKGKPVQVPLQIAAVIEQSQRDFPTSQSQAKRRQLTDIRDLDPAGGRGVGGVEIFL